MFVAWRDIRFATGRFVLIGSVVTLITILVGFLSGLTAGLANQNISAITGLDADRIVFSQPADSSADPSFADSSVTAAQAEDWARAEGISRVEPLGIVQSRLTAGARVSGVSLFGVQPSFGELAPAAGSVTLGESIARDLAVEPGDAVALSGHDLTVSAVVPDQWFSHTSVAWLNIEDWRSAMARGGEAPFASVLAVSASGSPDWTALDSATDTVSADVLGSLLNIGSFRSEIGSLLLMVGMLFGISALVIGAFFTVWTIQRSGDIAVLKALGAGTGRLVRDALGQALVVLLAGVGLGMLVTVGLGLLAGSVLPFVLSPLTTLLPALAMILLGLAGAGFALRSVLSTDPLTALGGTR
ncbi:ABC transporter permease [Mycetocola spongiae]|uniref:ABC transporter permease n=1 Tax=Mycetocola spongiae TaxID=2859226 RepID=UPI001CF40A4A|nr:ABC transporter permease [Mycetocola spongiae]UCR88012.1 ABC transporter permease [Mycetocola spongiae]